MFKNMLKKLTNISYKFENYLYIILLYYSINDYYAL